MLVIAGSACEPAAKPGTQAEAPVSAAPQADTSQAQPVPTGAVSQPQPAVDYEASARAHADSLWALGPVLAQADTTVEAEHFRRGDLNGDGSDDYLVLARGKRPCDEEGENSFCRTVFIVLNDKTAGLRVAAANAGLVQCSDCGSMAVGDPFQGFSIKGRNFSIEELGGNCEKIATTITFRYHPDRQDWLLQARDTFIYSCKDTAADGGPKTRSKHEGPRKFGVVRFADAEGVQEQ
ncbi:hypothetical protein GCM10023185_44360 [Hymenobacter saemangeumensis]|uniref:Lipoprotein n=1 Tax=Hymenobacter saemangeumensis TaxID=1084522 RepID=A0ABP8ISA5_9BACT